MNSSPGLFRVSVRHSRSAALAALLAVAGAGRADQSFITSGTADWNTGTNWNNGTVPSAEAATVDNGATVTNGAAAPGITFLNIGLNSTVAVATNGALADSGDVNFTDPSGLLLVDGGTLTMTGNRIQGGTTVVQGGGLFSFGTESAQSWGRVGQNWGPLTTLTIGDGGTVDADNVQDGLFVGDFHTHTILNLATNAYLKMGRRHLAIGWWEGGQAEAYMNGGTILFTNGSAQMRIGSGQSPAQGLLDMRAGASVLKAADDGNWGDFFVGANFGGTANSGRLQMEAGSLIDWARGAFRAGIDGATGVATNNGGTVVVRDAFFTVGGGGGNGTLVMNGGLLAHSNQEFYVGTDGGSVGALVVNGGTLRHAANSRFAVGNNGGTGSLTVNGAGTVVDTGPNEFQVGNDGGSVGTVTINDGTLDTHSWTAIGRNGAGNAHLILNGGTMNVKGDGNGGYLQLPAGPGGTSLVDLNGGVLRVTGNGGTIRFQDWGGNGSETWGTFNLNGGRLIASDIGRGEVSSLNHAVFNFNGGILQPTGGTVLHDLEAAYVRTNGAIIDMAGQGDTRISMPLLDGGGGGGVLVLGNGLGSGTANGIYLASTGSTYVGGLTLRNGAYVFLEDGAQAEFAGTGSVVLDGGGIKNANNNPILNRAITVTTNHGYFTAGWGKTLTIASPITGPGGVRINRDGDRVIFSNTGNAYQGDTLVGANGPGNPNGGYGRLQLGASDVIPNGPGCGNLVLDATYGGQLDLNGCNETVNGLAGNSGARVWNSGAASVLTVGDDDANGTYGGSIENAIGLTKIGAGVLTLTAVSSYTGATVVAAGTVLLSATPQPGLSQGRIGTGGMDTGTLNPNNEGVTLTTTAANSSAFPPWADNTEWIYTGYINNPGTSNVTWTFGENLDDHAWVRIDGTVVLNNGSWDTPTLGTYTLTPGSHFFEARFWNGGGGAGLVDSSWWQSGGTLGFAVDPQGRNETNMSYFVALADPGNGTVFTTGPKYNLLPAASTLVLNEGAVLDLGGSHQTFAGLIDGGSGGGTITNSSSHLAVLTVDAAAGSNHLFSGRIVDGAGGALALQKRGEGQLTLAGTNAFAAGTYIFAGTLRLGDGTRNGLVAGDITNDAALIFANGSAQTYGGALHGPGSLSKTGDGVLTLEGANDNSGPTTVNGGTLRVNGTLGSGLVTVAPGATLGGVGAILGGVASDGILAPGAAAPGMLTMLGNFTQSVAGTLSVRIGGPAACDQLLSMGTVTLGGTMTVSLVNGYAGVAGHAFTNITAGAIAGQFAATNLPALGAGLAWNVETIPGAFILSITNSTPPASGYDLAVTVITNGLSGYNDDADGDGYANLLEYVTGGSLTNADTNARMSGGRTNNVLALKFLRDTAATDATLYVEGSYTATNNADWVGIATNIGGSWGGSPTNVTESGSSPVNVTVQDTESAATNRFLRLRVTRP